VRSRKPYNVREYYIPDESVRNESLQNKASELKNMLNKLKTKSNPNKIEFANKVKDFKREGYSAKQAQYLAYEHFGENPPPLLFGQIEIEEKEHKEMSKYVELEPIKYIALRKETKVKSNPKKKATTFLGMVKSNCVGVKPNPQFKAKSSSSKYKELKDGTIDEKINIDNLPPIYEENIADGKMTTDSKLIYYAAYVKLASPFSYNVFHEWHLIRVKVTCGIIKEKYIIMKLLARYSPTNERTQVMDVLTVAYYPVCAILEKMAEKYKGIKCLATPASAKNILKRLSNSEVYKKNVKIKDSEDNLIGIKIRSGVNSIKYEETTSSKESFDESFTKPNPIKKEKLPSGDIRVFRTEDDKFVIVKKEKKSYGVYPGGSQFKRIGTPNKVAAIDKAIEILSRRDNPKRKSNPPKELEQLLYHGSPTKGIKQFSTKFRRFDTQAEGEGVYLTSDVNVARCYSGDEGSIYKVKIKHTDVFNARNETGFLKILNAVKLKTGIDLLQYKIIRDTVSAMKDGDYSVMGSNGLVWQIELILSNDSGFMQKYGDLNLKEVVRAAREEIDKVKVMCYMDPSISDRPLYLVKDPSVIRIVNEYPASKVKIKSEGLGVVLQSRPERSMGVKRQHEPEDDIDNEVRELIIKLYAEMTPIIEIARRVHLNPNLVKQVLINEGVEIRKGKPQKKSNPRVDVKDFMKEAAKSIVPLYEKLQVMKFGSGEFDQLMPIIIWSQGTFLFWPDNAIVTAFMIQALFESSSKVTDMKKTFKEVVARVVFDRSRTNKIVKKLDPKSLAVKTIDFFNND
jgi:hypothetical protein